MKNTEWKDKNNNIRCESCGKTIADNKIFREHGLGYCKKCYDDIQKYVKQEKGKQDENIG